MCPTNKTMVVIIIVKKPSITLRYSRKLASGIATKKESKTIDLEKSLIELEAVVERLEGGELSLEQALKEFEHGVKLTRECQAALKKAEQKVEILLKKTEDAAPEPFESVESN